MAIFATYMALSLKFRGPIPALGRRLAWLVVLLLLLLLLLRALSPLRLLLLLRLLRLTTTLLRWLPPVGLLLLARLLSLRLRTPKIRTIVALRNFGGRVHIHGVMYAHPVPCAFFEASDVTVQSLLVANADTFQKALPKGRGVISHRASLDTVT